MRSYVRVSDKHAISVTQSIAGERVRERERVCVCVRERERERDRERNPAAAAMDQTVTITNSLRKGHFVAGGEWKYLWRENGLDRVTNIEKE